jgi:hypothetical protein
MTNDNDLIRKPTVQELREMVHLDEASGRIFWKERKNTIAGWNDRCAGKETFIRTDRKGYKVGTLLNRHAKAHHVVWALTHGEWPTGIVDHIDGDKSNNAAVNLRTASPSQNNFNSRAYGNNKSGLKGVSWHKARGKWIAQIAANNRSKLLGYFDSKESAHAAYCAAAADLHGEFARTK